MNFITKKHLSRRTLLRGMGITAGLPLLDAMLPAQTPLAKTAANPLPRMGFIYVPHGAVMDKWSPKGTGTDFEFTPILKPLEPFRDRVLIVSGLANHNSDGGAHAITTPVWLSGVHPKKTEGVDVEGGVTVDQMAARRIGQDTSFPSIELATEDVTSLVGGCDSGYSCIYLNTISWRTPTMPLPMEINPRVVFERLLGDGGSASERLASMREDSSILDSITQEVGHLKKGLDPADGTRVTEYLENIREIERRIQQAEKQGTSQLATPAAPIGIPEEYAEHVKLMYDLLTLAYQANLTRVFTFMMARELSQRAYVEVGVPDPHHALSHHQNDPVRLAKLVKVQNFHMTLFAQFLDKLRNTPDGEGSLLDHSMILYGSNMSNSNLHNHYPLPALIAGGGAGRIQGGRHVQYQEKPMANLLLTLLDKVGVQADRFGDSTGKLTEI